GVDPLCYRSRCEMEPREHRSAKWALASERGGGGACAAPRFARSAPGHEIVPGVARLAAPKGECCMDLGATSGRGPLAVEGSAIERLLDEVSGALRGKPEAVRLALTALLARGHLLLEDVPGVGKTTLASALARAAGGRFARIQFTSDLLPSDIVGVSVF